VIDVAENYCDRLFVDLDDVTLWPPDNRDKWVEVCQIVTELESSDVH
jgi:hypothetical protein